LVYAYSRVLRFLENMHFVYIKCSMKKGREEFLVVYGCVRTRLFPKTKRQTEQK